MIASAPDPTWWGLRVGDGVFTTVRVKDAGAFDWAAHLARLTRNAAAYDLGPPPDDARLRRALAARLQEAGLTRGEATARIALWRTHQGGVGPEATGVVVEVFRTTPGPREPIALALAAGPGPMAAKAASYGPRFRARAAVRAVGAGDAVILNAHGRVAGGVVANLFALKGRTLATPPLSEGALDGTARAWALDTAEGFGLKAAIRPLTVEDLARANLLVLTNAVQGPHAARLEGAATQSPGPLFAALRAAWDARLPETPLLP